VALRKDKSLRVKSSARELVVHSVSLGEVSEVTRVEALDAIDVEVTVYFVFAAPFVHSRVGHIYIALAEGGLTAECSGKARRAEASIVGHPFNIALYSRLVERQGPKCIVRFLGDSLNVIWVRK